MIDLQSDQFFMTEALRQAQRAYLAGEVPVGAVVVSGGRGVVHRIDRGEYVVRHESALELVVELSGKQFAGELQIVREADGPQRWSVTFKPACST